MTSTFETIIEIALSASDITQHINQVSVGWGRSQTQFRGLRAKDAPRDPTLPEKVDKGILSPLDDEKVRLHWRGDGECLALSRIECESDKPPKRIVRVYTREGQIDSFSEPIDGLEGVLHWRPSGHWIATVQRRSETETEVVFLERNGLRHGGFKLRKPLGARVRDLAWNADSSILAVSLEDRIQLWMSSNYEWQLKKEFSYKEKSFGLVWHPEKPFISYVYTAGNYFIALFNARLCRPSRVGT
jgi:elongator complex protein 1